MARDISSERNSSESQNSKLQLLQLISLGRICSLLIHELCPPTQAAIFKIARIKQKLSQAHIKQPIELDHLETCLECIKNLIRLGQGNYSNNTSFNLNQAICQVKQIVGYRAKQNQVKIINCCPRNLNLQNNQFYLSLVLTNLILNSIEAYSSNKQHQRKNIKIKAVMTDCHCNRRVIIEVRDWAGGIILKDQSEIYQAFNTTKRSNKNLGLGLNISQLLASQKLHGSLKHQNVSQGTRFILTIPCAEESQS